LTDSQLSSASLTPVQSAVGLTRYENGEGYVFKLMGRGNYNLYYITINKNMCYIYEEEMSTMPLEVVFVEGCYVERMSDYVTSGKYGVKLSHHSDTFKEVYFYVDSQTTRDLLFSDLKQKAKSKSIEEFFTLKE
jgi:hypothetical protein